MRFLFRAIAGLALALATLAVIAFGAHRFMEARELAEQRPSPPPRERVYVVNAVGLKPSAVRPKLTAYGEVLSWRTLELRAEMPGRLVFLSPNVRDGGIVEAGEKLAVIDPADPKAQQVDAEAGVAEMEAELAEAREAVSAAEQERGAAERQQSLRVASLQRQRSLLRGGFGTRADVETAELALAAAEQTVLNREQMVIGARKRVERSGLKLERARITLAEAERSVGETVLTAPFAGRLTAVNVVLGRLVSVNEKLAKLVDPTALEAAFRVSNREYSRLLDSEGRLQQLALTVGLQLGDRRVLVDGSLERVDPLVGSGQSGRKLFARLSPRGEPILHPGDFVTVTITEPELSRVAVIPATAAHADGTVLVVGDDGKLTENRGTIERRQGDQLFVSGLPFGQRIVAERLPQLGTGVRVRIAEAPAQTAAGQTGEAPRRNTIALAPERRERLKRAIEGARQLPADRKQRILELLARPEVPRRLVERIEARLRQAKGS